MLIVKAKYVHESQRNLVHLLDMALIHFEY